MKRTFFLALIVLIAASFTPAELFSATSMTLDAATLVPNVNVSFSPRTGSFVEGSTFQVPIILDTNGNSINGIEVRLNYDSDRLAIVQASTGQSIVGVWVEPPTYDNTRGTASYVGVVPNGIVTESGVIGTITFRAKAVGRAVLSVRSDSNILLNDGLGSPTTLEKGRAEYSVITKPPAGVNVYSETHPSQNTWYNNNSPSIAWDTELGVTGFSYVLDNKPNTVPENKITSSETVKGFENLQDGLSYFHIKAYKNGAWGGTTHFLMRVDTTPPARFTPQVDYVVAAVLLANRTLVSFFTTDNLSGVERYEVGVIDKSAPATESPVFVEAESPFQVSTPTSSSGMTVIVRAIDRAGNVRDESVDVRPPSTLTQFINNNIWIVALTVLLLIVLGFLARLFFGRHIHAQVNRVIRVLPIRALSRPPAVTPDVSAADQEPIDLRPHPTPLAQGDVEEKTQESNVEPVKQEGQSPVR